MDQVNSDSPARVTQTRITIQAKWIPSQNPDSRSNTPLYFPQDDFNCVNWKLGFIGLSGNGAFSFNVVSVGEQSVALLWITCTSVRGANFDISATMLWPSREIESFKHSNVTNP
ncbi:unnamed protein product [Aphanomyces euteiches]